MSPIVRRLLQDELGRLEDNLYRAKLQAGVCDPGKLHGKSGQTLNAIITEYQTAIIEIKKELQECQE